MLHLTAISKYHTTPNQYTRRCTILSVTETPEAVLFYSQPKYQRLYNTTPAEIPETVLYYPNRNTTDCTILPQSKHQRLYYTTPVETPETVLYYPSWNTRDCTILPQSKHQRLYYATPSETPETLQYYPKWDNKGGTCLQSLAIINLKYAKYSVNITDKTNQLNQINDKRFYINDSLQTTVWRTYLHKYDKYSVIRSKSICLSRLFLLCSLEMCDWHHLAAENRLM
jgi:hypothetical protein